MIGRAKKIKKNFFLFFFFFFFFFSSSSLVNPPHTVTTILSDDYLRLRFGWPFRFSWSSLEHARVSIVAAANPALHFTTSNIYLNPSTLSLPGGSNDVFKQRRLKNQQSAASPSVCSIDTNTLQYPPPIDPSVYIFDPG